METKSSTSPVALTGPAPIQPQHQDAGLATQRPGRISHTTCPTHLILDVPATEDEFKGTHESVAQAIAELIVTPQGEGGAEGGISIGLEGSWGAGKTTVYKLLAKQLVSEHTALFLFNAWEHEGDPLRRSFLEALIKYLQAPDGSKDQPWIDKEKWNKKLKILTQQKEEKTTKTKPQLTLLGKIVGVSLLLIPLGNVFLSAAYKTPVRFAWPPDPYTTFYVLAGYFLLLAPLMELAVYQLLPTRWRARLTALDQEPAADAPHPGAEGPGGPGAAKKGARQEPSVLPLLFSKLMTEEVVEIDKTPNPTAVEFEETFQELMGEALGDRQKGRRLVLVLDNLDRIDPAAALSIWSTLQTFLKHRDKGVDWFARVWILILYDRDGLSALWEKGEKVDRKGKVAASFIDKSFQVRFEVPAPVLSNWRDFLIKQLAAALPEHDLAGRQEFHSVYRVMEIERSRNKQPPPAIREIKLYVNQIGALHRLWAVRQPCKGGFSLALLAYYVLLRRRPDTDIVSLLFEHKLPDPEFGDLLGESAADALAALTFNVKIKDARQMILKDTISSALQRGEKDELIKIADNTSGFWEVTERIIKSEWHTSEAIMIARAAYCLDESNLFADADPALTGSVIAALKGTAAKVESWTPLGDEHARGIASLCGIIKDDEFAVELLRTVTANFTNELRAAETPNSTPAAKRAQEWAQKMRVVLSRLQTSGAAHVYVQAIIEPLGNTVRSPLGLNSAQLCGRLAALCELRQILDDASGVPPPAGSNPAGLRLSDLVKEGHVLRQLKSNVGATEPRADKFAWCLFVLLRENAGASPTPFRDWAQAVATVSPPLSDFEAERLPDTLTDILAHYGELDMLLKTLDETAPAPPRLVIDCLKRLGEEKYPELNLSLGLFLKHWSVIQAEMDRGQPPLQTPFDRLVALLVEKKKLDAFVRDGFDQQQAAVYERIYVNRGPTTDFQTWLLSNLESLDEAAWDENLWKETRLLGLVNTLATSGAVLARPEHLGAALLKYARGVLAGRIKPTHTYNNLADILGREDAAGRTTFRQQLLDVFLQHVAELRADTPPVFFDLYGKELIASRESTKLAALAATLLPAALAARQGHQLRWLTDLISSHPTVLGDRLPKELETELRKVFEAESDPNIYEPLGTLAGHLKIYTPAELAKRYEKIIVLASEAAKDDSRMLLAEMIRLKSLYKVPYSIKHSDNTTFDLTNILKGPIPPLQHELSKIGAIKFRTPEEGAALEAHLQTILTNVLAKVTDKFKR